MPEHILLGPSARRFLDSKSQSERERIHERLRRLLNDPIPSDAKFIHWHEGERVFRYRIGKYRALYKIKEDGVLVVRIDKRSRVYK